METECLISSDVISRFRDERLSSVSSLLSGSSPISLSQRWNVFFHCTLQLQPDLIRKEVKLALMDAYKVSSLDPLAPKFVRDGEEWGALVSPGIESKDNMPIALVDHWFITNPSDFLHMFKGISQRWPFPFAGIRLSLSPSHPSASYLRNIPKIHLQEHVYLADWKHHPPQDSESCTDRTFSMLVNQSLEDWLPDLWDCFRSSWGGQENSEWKAHIRANLERSLENGGLLTIYDSQGFAGMISWYDSSDAELLLVQYWHISFIFVRPDLRNQKVGQYLYGLAAQQMNLEKTGLMGARVQAENLASHRALEKAGAERVMDYLIFSS